MKHTFNEFKTGLSQLCLDLKEVLDISNLGQLTSFSRLNEFELWYHDENKLIIKVTHSQMDTKEGQLIPLMATIW